MNNLDEFMEFTEKTAVYPEANAATMKSLTYSALGLAGEAGEVADKVKKLLRDGDTPVMRDAIKKELGDVLWYWTRMCRELRVAPSDVMNACVEKLTGRLERGTIHGSGDDR